MRTITSFIRIEGSENKVVPVKTKEGIPKGKIWQCMKEIKQARVKAPVNVGDILIENAAGSGVPVVATGQVKG